MKVLAITIFTAIAFFAPLLPHASARGLHWGGGHNMGHVGGSNFSGGSQRNFGRHGSFTNPGSPAFRSPGFDQFQNFHQRSYFGPHQHRGPLAPYYGKRHRPHRHFSGSRYVFRQRGIPYFSSGTSRHSLGSTQRFGPAGLPPLGAPGLTPYGHTTGMRTRFPFYCALHSFGYTNQHEFFDHLNFAHHVPLDRAAAYCRQVGTGLIFSGF